MEVILNFIRKITVKCYGKYLIYLSIYYHIHNQKKVLINFKMEAGEAEAKWDCILFVSFRFEALQKADSNV